MIDQSDELKAVEYLRSLGYTISPPKNRSLTYSNSQLVEMFYDNLKLLVPENVFLTLGVDKAKDFAAIKAFQTKLEKTGYSKELTNKLLYDVLTLFFERYELLRLLSPPTSLDYLLSPNGAWIIKKLLSKEKKIYDGVLYTEDGIEKIETVCEAPNEHFIEAQRVRHEALLKLSKGDVDG